MEITDQLIYGRHPLADAIRAGVSFDKVYFQMGITGEVEKEVRHLCKEFNIPLQVVPKERLDRTTRANHQGVIGFASLISYHKLADIVPAILKKGKNPLLVMLDGVTDVRNFGAIARSAEAAGADAIIVPSRGAALTNADAMKASAGALALIPVCRENSLHVAAEYLVNCGISLAASSSEKGLPLYEVDFTMPTALMIGSEGEGIQPTLLRKADFQFKIPMLGKTDSFNVSVATGIALYEVTRQRALI